MKTWDNAAMQDEKDAHDPDRHKRVHTDKQPNASKTETLLIFQTRDFNAQTAGL